MNFKHQHQHQPKIQKMFCMKDGLKFFDKDFKKLFKYESFSAIFDVIKNEEKNCSVCEMAESSGETLLHLAAKYGQAEVATYLISNGCDVDARTSENGCTPLMLAAAYGYIDICQILLDANADIFATNFLGESILYMVTESFGRNYSHLNFFVKKLQRLQLSDEELATKLIQTGCPLYYIVRLNQADITVMLRQRGYTIPKSSTKDHLLLHDAVYLKNLENVKFVLEQMDLDVNYLDNFDYAPLHYAVAKGDKDGDLSIIKYLLDKGADINIQGHAGMTPLLVAFKGQMPFLHKEHCIFFLLQQGADPQILDFEGYTVIDYALASFRGICFDETLLDPVLSHLALQEALGVPIIDKLRKQIDSDEGFNHHFHSCKLYLEYMKDVEVRGGVNLYEILTESEEKVLEYMRNPETAVGFIRTIFDRNSYYRYVMNKRCFDVLEVIKKEKQRNLL